MANDTDIIDWLKDPSVIQSRILTQLATQVTGGQTVPSGNNVAAFLINQMGSISAAFAQEGDRGFEALYRVRAQSMVDLYRHISDFDYLGVFSYPATTAIAFIMDKQYLLESAPVDPVNPSYKKVIIPKDTTFTMGTFTFGIYYPIIIRINTITRAVLIEYDTSSMNPLFTLEQADIENATYAQGGSERITFQIPVYQFERKFYRDEVVEATGYSRTVAYTNKFYACRVFHLKAGVWQEFQYTLSDKVYDPATPTVKLVVSTDTNTLTMSIPQVYLTSGLVGSTIRAEVYTTQGSLDVNVSTVVDNSIKITFDSSLMPVADDIYVAPLRKLPILERAFTSVKIVGGSNGLSFDEFKDLVVSNSFNDGVLVTPADIQKQASLQGFTILRHLDNITDRIYYAHRPIRTAEGLVGAAFLPIEFDSTTKPAQVLQLSDNTSYLTLPTALFKYNTTRQVAELVTDTERATLDALPPVGQVAAYNDSIYLTSPFHILINTASTYPLALTYDLVDPQITKLVFDGDNTSIASQMSIYQMLVYHKASGTGGFQMDIWVRLSDDLAATAADLQTKVLIHTVSTSGTPIGLWATQIVPSTQEGYLQFSVPLATDYDIQPDDSIDLSAFLDSTLTPGHRVNLTTPFTLVFYALTQDLQLLSELSGTDWNIATPGFAQDLVLTDGLYTALSAQTATIQLGRRVAEIFNPVDIQYQSQTYLTRTTTKFATYPDNIWEIDPVTNVPAYTVDPQTQIATLNKLHSLGDVICDVEFTLTGAPTGFDGTYRMTSTKTALSTAAGVFKLVDPVTPAQLATPETVCQVVDTFKMMLALVDADAIDCVATVATLTALGELPTTVRFAWVTAIGLDAEVPVFHLVEHDPEDPEDPVGAFYRRHEVTNAWIKMAEFDTFANLKAAIAAEDPVVHRGYAYQFTIDSSSVTMFKVMSYTGNTWNLADENGAPITGWPWDTSLQQFNWFRDTGVKVSGEEFGLIVHNPIEHDGWACLEYDEGDIVLDPVTKVPQQAYPRTLVYQVGAVLVDAKPTKCVPYGTTTAAVHHAYTFNQAQNIRAYFAPFASVKSQMLEVSKFYFRPLRTVGLSTYNQGSTPTRLDCTVAFRLMVSRHVYLDTTQRNAIEAAVLTIVQTHIASGSISLTEVAAEIVSEMDGLVTYVDVQGINGDVSFQTLTSVESGTAPMLRSVLALDEFNGITLESGLTVEFVIAS